MRADLHIHTYYSDGKLSPADVAAFAARAGVGLVSVTDHDTVCGNAEAQKYCTEKGIAFVCGIEVSAYFGDVKIHTLGYGMDINNADLKGFLNELKAGAVKRSEDIIFKLNRAGVALSLEEAAAERYSAETPLHAMHIAEAGAKKGFAGSPFAFFTEYLAYGKSAYSDLCRPSPEETAEVLTAAGGFCSLAHPGRIFMAEEEKIALIKRMKACGLCGIEAVYSGHTAKETAYYKEIAKRFGLFVTGGSDTHYAQGNRQIGAPYFQPSEALLQKLCFDKKDI